jgi:hypothetical protein
MQAEADTPHPCNYLVYGRRVAGSTGHLASLDREAIKGRETYKGSTLFGTAKAVPFRFPCSAWVKRLQENQFWRA